MKQLLKTGIALVASGALFFGCENSELEQSTVAFMPPTALSLSEGSSESATFELVFSRPLDAEGSVTIQVESPTAQQGVHYEPSVTSFLAGEFRVPVQAGSSTATFSIKSLDDDSFTNGHTLTLKVKDVAGGVRSAAGEPAILQITDNDPPTTRATFDFEDCPDRFETPPGFTEERVPGSKTDRGWGCQPFGFVGQGVQASGFGGESGIVNAWLLLDLESVETIDLSSYNAFYVGFWVESYFGGSGTIELKYSTEYPGSGNPEDYTWNILPIASQLPPPGSGQENAPDGFWKQIFVDASVLAGQSNVHLALQYNGSSNTSSASWTVDSFTLYGD